MNIIDCHSHIGNDWSWGSATLPGYLDLLEKTGVDTALLMPVPNQVDSIKNNSRLLIWDFSLGQFKYYSELKNVNPTSKLFNDPIATEILSYTGDKKLYFIPFIHPILDNPEYLYELISLYHPVAFKIHGVAHGITPGMIGEEFIKALQKINIPIIVHTDFSIETESLKGYIKSQNTPFKWAEFFIKNSLKGYITHAARLDIQTLNLVNNCDNLVVGLGPDLLLLSNPAGLKDLAFFSASDILNILKSNVDINKIMFDIDYSWNVSDNERRLDYEMVDRVNSTFSLAERQKVLRNNAVNFFDLGK